MGSNPTRPMPVARAGGPFLFYGTASGQAILICKPDMLLDQAQEFIGAWEQEHGKRLWGKKDTLVIGVSGGPDSLALLHLFAVQGLHPTDKLVVGHLNHELRQTAAADARFVQQICEAWQVPCVVEVVDVTAVAGREGASLEEAGRLARYRFLGRLAERTDAAAVLVGHTADDQVETVLMHFVRGTGLAGLQGMLPVSPLPGSSDQRLVRPLLGSSRQEVESYCREHGLSPRFDASNEDLTFFRNRLRHELLPLLRQYNPQIRERLLHTAEVVRAELELLDRLEEEAWHENLLAREVGWLRVDLEGWRHLPLGLRRRTLRLAVWRLHSSLRDVSFRAVELARRVAETGQVGAKATLPGGLELTVEYDAWRLSAPDVSAPVELPQVPAGDTRLLAVPGRVQLAGGWFLEAGYLRVEEKIDPESDTDRWSVILDADVAGKMLVRGRRRGERFQPLGMEGQTAKVSDFMINEKIPARLRDRWPIVANERHLLWLVGFRADERARVTSATSRRVIVRCLGGDSGAA